MNLITAMHTSGMRMKPHMPNQDHNHVRMSDDVKRVSPRCHALSTQLQLQAIASLCKPVCSLLAAASREEERIL